MSDIYQPAPLRRPGIRPWMLLVIVAAGYVAMSYGIPVYFWLATKIGGAL